MINEDLKNICSSAYGSELEYLLSYSTVFENTIQESFEKNNLEEYLEEKKEKINFN